jgi:hypothetical protein
LTWKAARRLAIPDSAVKFGGHGGDRETLVFQITRVDGWPPSVGLAHALTDLQERGSTGAGFDPVADGEFVGREFM